MKSHLGKDEINPYSCQTNEYECPINCEDMSTQNFLLYSLMVLALGFFIGVAVGVLTV